MTAALYTVDGSRPLIVPPLVKFSCGEPTSVVPFAANTRTVYEVAFATGAKDTRIDVVDSWSSVGATGVARRAATTVTATSPVYDGELSPFFVTATVIAPVPTDPGATSDKV